MSLEFNKIFRGLMDNRGLSIMDVSMTSLRSQSTMHHLLNSTSPPDIKLLEDISPILGINFADLLVITGLTGSAKRDRQRPYRAPAEMVNLVMTAGMLNPEQVEQVTRFARALRETHRQGSLIPCSKCLKSDAMATSEPLQRAPRPPIRRPTTPN